MALSNPQHVAISEPAVALADSSSALTPQASASLRDEGRGLGRVGQPVPTPPAQAAWVLPAEPAPVVAGSEVVPATSEPGWTAGVLVICGIAALLIGALVGYLVVHAALAG